MREEKNRLETFKDCNFSVNSHVLAKAGFYYTHKANLLECSMCHFQIDATNVNQDENRIIALHKKEKPECTFNQNVKRSISKKFDSYDSLRFEKERLNTYIDWPLEWLEPSDLARDGFYYLRTNDHVACVFCRGIVGSWERGDTPRGEHQRHFPHCQFIRNQPVGNFPLIFNEKFEGYSIPLRNSKNLSYRQGIDVCGLSPMTDNGVHQHTIAKRKDYLTLESRLASFNNWPERVTQKPTELSEAGFFYCGLSDHVRCYHCGNGLRNWETDDIPWDEHARWYPECTFLFLMKGKEFIDQVQGERPPYETNPSITHINEDQHKLIKELDITKHLISMGFQEDHVMTTYHNQLKEKGLPFFDIGSFIEAVLQYMEDEVRKCLVNKLALAEVDVVPSPPMSDRNELASDTNQQVESSTTLMELALAEVDVVPSQPMSDGTELASDQNQQVESSTTLIQPIVDELALAEVDVVPSQPMSDGTELASDQNQQVESSTTLIQPIVDELALAEVDVVPSQPMSDGTEVESTIVDELTLTEVDVVPSPPMSGDSNPQPLFGKITDQVATLPKSEGTIRHRVIECKICMENESELMFLPCNHICTCFKCASNISTCPICRAEIKYTIKAIIS
nr:baculoviral IAP repeat-containing protein 7-like [Procambarus clarkii]